MPTDDILAIIGRADELYRRRGEPGAVRESVMVLSGARNGSEKYEVQWRLARALFFLGQQAETRESRRQLFSAGIGAGERAVALNYSRVEGHFWVGVNLAMYAEATGGIRGARAIRWARSELRLAVKQNEAYHDAGPLRVLARIEHKAPRLLGGNRKLSRKHFDRALDLAPRNSVTLLYRAELALDEGDRPRAIAMLESIIANPTDHDWEFENKRDSELARQMLERLRRGE